MKTDEMRCACGALMARIISGRISIKYKDFYISFTQAKNVSIICRSCGNLSAKESLSAAA